MAPLSQTLLVAAAALHCAAGLPAHVAAGVIGGDYVSTSPNDRVGVFLPYENEVAFPFNTIWPFGGMWNAWNTAPWWSANIFSSKWMPHLHTDGIPANRQPAADDYDLELPPIDIRIGNRCTWTVAPGVAALDIPVSSGVLCSSVQKPVQKADKSPSKPSPQPADSATDAQAGGVTLTTSPSPPQLGDAAQMVSLHSKEAGLGEEPAPTSDAPEQSQGTTEAAAAPSRRRRQAAYIGRRGASAASSAASAASGPWGASAASAAASAGGRPAYRPGYYGRRPFYGPPYNGRPYYGRPYYG